jgi:probable HAF family extracellular repeat protein
VHINKRGQVIGNRPAGKPFLWERGGSQELPLDFAMAINDEGKVVGGVMAPNAAGVLKRRAALWEDGVVTDLGTLGGDESWAVAIGKNGWIAGSSKTEPRKVFNRPNLIPVTIAFRWRDGVMEDLGLPGNESEWRVPPLVSDQGNVVVQDPTQCVSLIWEDVAWQVIGPGCTYVQAMNAQGAVTGARNSFSVGPAFVWQHGVRHDLAVPGRGSRGNAINNQGIVVGNTGNNGVPQAAMWVPVAAALQVN